MERQQERRERRAAHKQALFRSIVADSQYVDPEAEDVVGHGARYRTVAA